MVFRFYFSSWTLVVNKKGKNISGWESSTSNIIQMRENMAHSSYSSSAIYSLCCQRKLGFLEVLQCFTLSSKNSNLLHCFHQLTEYPLILHVKVQISPPQEVSSCQQNGYILPLDTAFFFLNNCFKMTFPLDHMLHGPCLP